MSADSFHFDTETYPLTPEEQAPELVCLQYCLAPAPRLVGASRTGASRSDGRLVDTGEAWRGMTSLDVLGPCPADEATEDDDPDEIADDAHPGMIKSCKPWPEQTRPVLLDSEEAIDAYRWAIEDTDLLIVGLNV